MKIIVKNLLIGAFLITPSITFATTESFSTGPIFETFGKHTQVKQDLKLDKKQQFRVAFDVATQGKEGEINRKFDSLARFINMHVANGIPRENIHLSLVVHGKAGFDLLNEKAYQDKYQKANGNYALLSELMKNQVDIYLCGQSAGYYEIDNTMLQKGVKMALSAMTAHAVLQQKGYTINPF